jgi:hypothetical protein
MRSPEKRRTEAFAALKAVRSQIGQRYWPHGLMDGEAVTHRHQL